VLSYQKLWEGDALVNRLLRRFCCWEKLALDTDNSRHLFLVYPLSEIKQFHARTLTSVRIIVNQAWLTTKFPFMLLRYPQQWHIHNFSHCAYEHQYHTILSFRDNIVNSSLFTRWLTPQWPIEKTRIQP